MTDSVVGIGNSTIWMFPSWHPFYFFPAKWHDEQYEARERGELNDSTSTRVDLEFRERCLMVANTCLLIETQEPDKILFLEVESFFSIARLWGVFKWPKPKKVTAKEEQNVECNICPHNVILWLRAASSN